jgi:hypothetical protein
MHPIAPVTISFVLRFWLEHREIEGAEPVWRGVVEHVPSGKRHYFEKLNQIPVILAGYVDMKNIVEIKKEH